MPKDVEPIVKIIVATVGEVAGQLVRALVDGDRAAWRRVNQIIPDPMSSEAKLAHEEARLEALEREDTNP